MQSKYVTWYGHHHLVFWISIIKATSWSPSSRAWHLDLHRGVVVVSPTIASTTITKLSDKVKQLHGVCISYNKVTTIRLLPVADNFYKTWSLIRPFLHHAFISIFIALWTIISHYGTILMPFLSYFTRFTWRGRMPAAGILAGKGANIGNLFCTAPKDLKLHESHFIN